MALSDEPHYGYVKQVALDWRESVRERRNIDFIPSSPSVVSTEKITHPLIDSKTQGRVYTMGTAKRRESSFYHQKFVSERERKSVEIERGEGNAESDRIRVSTDVNLYLHQPIPLNNAIRSSLEHARNAER